MYQSEQDPSRRQRQRRRSSKSTPVTLLHMHCHYLLRDLYTSAFYSTILRRIGHAVGISRYRTNIPEKTQKPEASAQGDAKEFGPECLGQKSEDPQRNTQGPILFAAPLESLGDGNNVAQNSLQMRDFCLHGVCTARNFKSKFRIVAPFIPPLCDGGDRRRTPLNTVRHSLV